MGGLGHMAVKLAAAMGAEVTVLSRTLGKQEDGKRLGATHYFATQDEATFTDNASTLRPDHQHGQRRPADGLLHGAAAPARRPGQRRACRPSPTRSRPSSVVGGSRALAGSAIGGIAQTQEMLDFCAEHSIGAEIEIIGADQVNEAYDRVVSSDVRYRFVIDTATIKA